MDRPGFRRIWALGVLLLWIAAGRADLPMEELPAAKLPGESAPTARRLAEARKRVEQEQWADAIEEYQRILEEAGDDLVPLNLQKPRHCVQARRLVHAALAALPPTARRLYQKRVDEQAQKLQRIEIVRVVRQHDPIELLGLGQLASLMVSEGRIEHRVERDAGHVSLRRRRHSSRVARREYRR